MQFDRPACPAEAGIPPPPPRPPPQPRRVEGGRAARVFYNRALAARGMVGTAACILCGASLEPHGGGRRVYCERCTAKADRDVASAIDAECKECGKAFSTKNRLVRYCSDKCRFEGKRRLKREYRSRYLADPEKHAMYLARMRAASARRRRAMAGKRPAGGGGGRRKDAHAAARQPRRPSTAKPRACKVCGRSFVARGTSPRIHCKQCVAKFAGEVSRVLKVKCKECGKEFSTKNRAVRYCSSKCSAEVIRRRLREYARRSMADPEQRAILSARGRARKAAKAGKRGERRK